MIYQFFSFEGKLELWLHIRSGKLEYWHLRSFNITHMYYINNYLASEHQKVHVHVS